MAEPKYVKEFRAEIAEMKRRQDEIGGNTISHLDRVLDDLAPILRRLSDAPQPQAPPSAPPINPDPLPVTATHFTIGMTLQGAADFMARRNEANTRDQSQIDAIAVEINNKWPGEWRNLPRSQSGLIQGTLHALGGQGV